MKKDIVPISKVFNIIDSCINNDQLKGCKKLVDSYINLIKHQGVVNFDIVDEILKIKLQEKLEKIERVKNFNVK